MSLPGAPAQRDFLGLSPALLWGYVAIALFMTGDGLEQAFLSDYLVTSLGYTHEQSGTLFTVYGLVIALGGVLAAVLVSGRARSRASAARSARRSRCPSATRRSRSAWCSASSTRSPCTPSSS